MKRLNNLKETLLQRWKVIFWGCPLGERSLWHLEKWWESEIPPEIWAHWQWGKSLFEMCGFYMGIAQIALDPTPCPKPSWQALAPLGNVGKKYPKPYWQAFTPSPFKAIGAMPIWKQHISKRGIQRGLERYREWGERRRARRRTLSGLDRREIWRQLLSGLALQLNSTAIRPYTVDNSGTTEASCLSTTITRSHVVRHESFNTY